MKTCYIIGGGPSLTNFNWSLLDGHFVIAINRAYEKLPNADIIYFTDIDFWETHKANMKKLNGRLIRGTLRLGTTKDPSVKEYKLTGATGIDTTPDCLKHGNNSVHAAINLALFHLGFDIVYLLGVDMKWKGKQTHWHDGHRRIDNQSVYKQMISNFEEMSKELKKYPKKQVININDDSELKCFPVISVEQAFQK